MSAVMGLASARDLARNATRREMDRRGGTLSEARGRIAQAMGVMPGTLYNLVYDRLKRLDDDLRSRLSAYAIEDLEHEIRARRHELEMARALGGPADPDAVTRIQAIIDEAIALLDETRGRP